MYRLTFTVTVLASFDLSIKKSFILYHVYRLKQHCYNCIVELCWTTCPLCTILNLITWQELSLLSDKKCFIIINFFFISRQSARIICFRILSAFLLSWIQKLYNLSKISFVRRTSQFCLQVLKVNPLLRISLRLNCRLYSQFCLASFNLAPLCCWLARWL